MIQETHDLRYSSKSTEINVHNGGKLVLHQARYKDQSVKTIVTGLSGESIFYTAQQQTIQILAGKGALSKIEHLANGQERFVPLTEQETGKYLAPENATVKLRVTEAPCVLMCTPENDPNQPGGKDHLPVVR